MDENGNPVVPSKDKYMQMREAPSLIASGKSGRFETRPDGFLDVTPRDSENDHLKQEKRKRKKLNKEIEKKSEEIENYVGNKSIEELVNFIGGNNAGVKKSKKPVSTNSENIPAKTTGNKITKKSKDKDKKQKPLTASASLDKLEQKTEESVHIDFPETESEGYKNMGNSGTKNDYHFAEDRNSVSEVIMKDLLKDNDRKSSVIESDEVIKKKIETEKDSNKVKETSKQPSSPEAETESEVTEHKKKNDKNGKAQKQDKVEKPQTDEVAKLNTKTSAVSVKQKNAKNKKSKPSNSTQKVENQTEKETVNQEVPSISRVNHEVSSISSIANDVLIDNKFIFTDIDLQTVPKEDEFKVVEKKKKKPTREGQNHYISANNNHKPSRFLEDKRMLPSAGSNKLSASDGTNVTKSAETDTRMRDLSPSAFPALNSGKGRMQDGRRNSTGDVPILSEIALKAQDDSDIESVKSLPATQGSRAAETLISPRLNMSYAKMAASPKQRGEDHDDKSSGFVDPEEPERKVAFWKGSPTERRHSIGSSPDGKVGSVNSSSATSNSVKSGSQEMLNIDTIPKGQRNSTNVSSKELNDSVVCNMKDITDEQEHIAAKVSSTSISLVQNSGVSHKGDAELTSTNIKTSVNTKTKTNSDAPSIKTTKNISNTKTLNSSRKTKPCSVIFLDKRLTEPTNNLGITFGFDNEPSDKTAVAGSKSESDSDANAGSIDSIHSVAPTVTFLSDLEDEILPSEQTSSDDSSSANVINVVRDSTGSATELVHKVAEHVGQLNGIVKTSQGQQSQRTETINEVQSKGASNPSVEAHSEEPSCGKRFENEVVVYYGENVATVSKNISVPSLTNGPTHYCGKVVFVPEVEGIKGTFNIHDAVAFLTGGKFRY